MHFFLQTCWASSPPQTSGAVLHREVYSIREDVWRPCKRDILRLLCNKSIRFMFLVSWANVWFECLDSIDNMLCTTVFLYNFIIVFSNKREKKQPCVQCGVYNSFIILHGAYYVICLLLESPFISSVEVYAVWNVPALLLSDLLLWSWRKHRRNLRLQISCCHERKQIGQFCVLNKITP